MRKQAFAPAAAAAVLYLGLAWLRQAGFIGIYWGQIMDLALSPPSGGGPQPHLRLCRPVLLGHAAFYGLGAYVAAFVTRAFGGNTLTFALALAAGAATAGLVALLIGLPILRLRSDYLASRRWASASS